MTSSNHVHLNRIWNNGFIAGPNQINHDDPQSPPIQIQFFPEQRVHSFWQVVLAYRNAKKRAIFLDNEGAVVQMMSMFSRGSPKGECSDASEYGVLCMFRYRRYRFQLPSVYFT